MSKYVYDDICVLELTGIRYVIGRNVYYAKGPFWTLEIAYKGAVKDIKYSTMEARDAMYAKIIAHLDQKKVQP